MVHNAAEASADVGHSSSSAAAPTTQLPAACLWQTCVVRTPPPCTLHGRCWHLRIATQANCGPTRSNTSAVSVKLKALQTTHRCMHSCQPNRRNPTPAPSSQSHHYPAQRIPKPSHQQVTPTRVGLHCCNQPIRHTPHPMFGCMVTSKPPARSNRCAQLDTNHSKAHISACAAAALLQQQLAAMLRCAAC
jgi:hypothetical protein